jgi:hypothetical protein
MGQLVDVDAAAWPLVIVRIGEKLDVAAIDTFVQGIDTVLERKAKFVTIIDTTALSRLPNAIERRRLIEQMNRRTFAEKAYNLGNAVVIVSAPARAVLTAVNWVRPPMTTQHLVSNFAEALEWCCGRLAAAGIGLSPPLQALQVKYRTRM